MSASRPKIVFVANLWTLAGHPTPRREWSLARKVRAVAEAGFDAITAPASEELAALLAAHGLRFMGFFSSSDAREFRPLLATQRAAGAELVNVQLGDDFTSVCEGARLARTLMREARRQNIYAAVEVHRDTATETPEKPMRLPTPMVVRPASYCAHVGSLPPRGREALETPLFNQVLLQRTDLIQAARIFHLRPFNGQHAQVPVIDGRGRRTPEFLTWLRFAEHCSNSGCGPSPRRRTLGVSGDRPGWNSRLQSQHHATELGTGARVPARAGETLAPARWCFCIHVVAGVADPGPNPGSATPHRN